MRVPAFGFLLALFWTSFGLPSALAAGRLADVTVIDRASGRVLEAFPHDGRLWIAGRAGDEYRIDITNRTAGDLVAVVSVDGVNVISGETASPAQTGYVLSPGRVLALQGWRKNLRETAAFQFSSLADSYATRTGRPHDVGVIGVALFRRKPEPPPRPIPFSRGSVGESRAQASGSPAEAMGAARDEKTASQTATDLPREVNRSGPASADAAAPRAEADLRLGTGHGRREASFAREVAFQRATAEPEEVIEIRYDSRSNLVAQGVIRERPPVREPRAFPRFVPDPPLHAPG